MKISVILPFIDEAEALPVTLAHLDLANSLSTDIDIEIIAVDGGSRDDSVAIVRRHPRARVLHAVRGRAAQMNAGAAAASGDVLLFLHADTWLPPGAFTAMANAAASPEFVYGGFRHRFSGQDWRLALISALHNFRCRHAQTFYGDQAMFVGCRAFERAGGFPLVRAEDVVLSQRLRAMGGPAFLATSVVTSSRKFEQMGVWRSLARVLAIQVCMRLGWRLPAAFFADIR